MNVNKININQSEPTYYIESGAYDISAHNNGAVFESLQSLLNNANLSTLIPASVRCGGMSIRFVQNSDNKYVQYRYMGTETTGSPNPFLDTANWQGVDDESIAGSDNLVKSGAVANTLIVASKENAVLGDLYYNVATNAIQHSASWESYIFNVLNVINLKIIVDGAYTNSTSIAVIAFFDGMPNYGGQYISGINYINGVSHYESDIPLNCKYILVSSRSATAALGSADIFAKDQKAMWQFLLSNKHDIEDIPLLKNLTTTSKELSDYNQYKIGGCYANLKDSGIEFIESSAWYSWLIPVDNRIKKILNANLKADNPYRASIVFLNSPTLNNNNILGYILSAQSHENISVPDGCTHIFLCDRIENEPNPECTFAVYIENTCDVLQEEIENTNSKLVITKTINDIEKLQDGYYVVFNSQGVNQVGTSGSWESWLVPVVGVKNVISAKLGREVASYANVVYLSSDEININNVIGYIDNQSVIGEITYDNIVIPEGCSYVLFNNRIVNCASPQIDLSVYTDLQYINKKAKENEEDIQEIQQALQALNSVKQLGPVGKDFIVGQMADEGQTIRIGSDFTIINKNGVDYMLTFFAYDGGADAVELRVRAFGNGYNELYTYDKLYMHKFGHCNTVDYCKENDCLIFGNGGGSYGGNGEFYIIPNASEVFFDVEDNHEFTFENTTHIKYEVGRTFEDKVNTVWGERNGYKNNIIYIISNDNSDVSRILLGMGTAQLENGDYTAAASDEFNGTYKVLAQYHQDSIGLVNQGSEFHNGKIICGAGFSPNGISVIEMILDDSNNSIHTNWYNQKIYGNDGNVLGKSTNGLCFDKDNNLILGILFLYQIEDRYSNRGIIYTSHRL